MGKIQRGLAPTSIELFNNFCKFFQTKPIIFRYFKMLFNIIQNLIQTFNKIHTILALLINKIIAQVYKF